MKSPLEEVSSPGPLSTEGGIQVPSLAVIIVSYNVKAFLEQALRSVEKSAEGLRVETWVVDNASSDGSVEMVRSTFPWVKCIANEKNVGFSKANNQAIQASNTDFVLLLNPDTLVQEDTFSKCLSFMLDHPEAGAMGIRMVDGSGNFLPESKRGLPTPSTAFYKLSGISRLFPSSKTFSRYHLNYLSEQETHEVEVLSGAFMFMRRETLHKTGLLDETFFMYGEDIDLSYRILQAGYKNYYFPGSTIIHYKGESTKKTSYNYVYHFYNAMAIFARKHFGGAKGKLYVVLIQLAIFLKALISGGGQLARQIRLPIMDVALGWAGLAGFALFWESTFKAEPTAFPPEMFSIVLPIYLLIWMLSGWFVGMYDFPYSRTAIFLGSLVGFGLVGAATNFIETLRFSKAVILFGYPLMVLALVVSRLLETFLQTGQWNLSSEKKKRILVIGSKEEFKRAHSLIIAFDADHEVIGRISTSPEIMNGEHQWVGRFEDLENIVQQAKINELVYCAKDLPIERIIASFVSFKGVAPEFKIMPEGAEYIIGSHSKNARGNFYQADSRLAFNNVGKRRLKRTLEFSLALLIVTLFPIYVILKQRKRVPLTMFFEILVGKRWLVGPRKEVPLTVWNRKEALVYPDEQVTADNYNLKYQLNKIYLEKYHILDDLHLFWQWCKDSRK